MRLTNARKGFVLPLALVLTVCAGITVSGVATYLTGMSRQSVRYAAKNDCRLAAMSALDKVRGEIYEGFMNCTGIKAQLLKQSTLYWFTSVSTGDNYIGQTGPVYFDDVVKDVARQFPDHELRVRIAATPVIKGTRVHVPLIAAARRTDGTGEATLMATISYGMDRSRVFDHAYFVNNYGWFNGSTITANGDVRANGDMSLAQTPKINGHVYAARNDELRVLGNVKDGSGTFDSQSTYRGSQYGVANRARPLQLNDGDGGYEVPKSANARLHPQSEMLEMPWISDLNQYVEYGESAEIQSTLSQGATYFIDNRTSNKGKANYGYYTGTGPSGNAALPDNYALVLEGTQQNPIKLNGPVVVSNDVVIKGYVTGQGTIYSKRNIHIVGDIKYVNPPSWVNKSAAGSNNSQKDLLCLSAKGNIVLGDPTQSSWLSSTLKNCITTQPYVQQYACAENENYPADDTRRYGDADIGYPRRREYSEGTTKYNETKFCGNYTQADGGSKVKETKTEKFHNETYKDSRGRTQTRKVSDGYEYTYAKDTTRKYYDSVVPTSAIHDRASTITQIDAVLYNNHGIFGNIGACTINGSLVCRNEGMIFSGSLFINWDYRLYSGSPESVANSLVGMPVAAATPVIHSLQEVPDAWAGWPAEEQGNPSP